MIDQHPNTTYSERLKTFQGYWDGAADAAARQLSAIGHVYDRPPLETSEEGSRCVSCSAFVSRVMSIQALVGPTGSYREGFRYFDFHRPSCIRLQIRIPLEPQAALGGLYGGHRINEMRKKFDRITSRGVPDAINPDTQSLQTSPLFSLPTELRLTIYSYILPTMESVERIVPLNKDSAQVMTAVGHGRVGPRDSSQSNLLRTCRIIHSEALDLFFTNTTYQFDSTKTLYLFLRQIGEAGRRSLKSVDVTCGAREDAITFALLGSCDWLRSIKIRLPRPQMLMTPSPPLWVFDGMDCLLGLRGLQDVQFCAPGLDSSKWMDDSKPDAAIIRSELQRLKKQ